MPQPGGVMTQNLWLLECMRTARYIWYINVYKPAHKIPISPEDSAYMESILPKDYTLHSGFTKDAVQELAKAING